MKVKGFYQKCRWLCVLLLCSVQACSIINDPLENPTSEPSVTANAPALEAEGAIPSKTENSNVPDKQGALLKAHKKVKSIAIVSTKNNQGFEKIIQALRSELDAESEVFYLERSLQQQAKMRESIQHSTHGQVVAIGSLAAKNVEAITDKERVFCQVFNHQTLTIKPGVSMVPNADKLFGQWRQLSPMLKNVAVLTGSGHEQTVERLSKQAMKHGVALEHYVVENDRAMLFKAKSLMIDVQGYWLLPDNRVLSVNTMKELLSISVKQGKQVAVFNPNLFKYGGLLYVSADEKDIAHQLIKQLNSPMNAVIPLQDAKVEINPVVAKQFQLTRGSLQERLHE